MRIKAVLVGIVLTSATLASVAMSLGRARGAAWIGQPLSLVVPVQLDAGQNATSICAEADVFHAETKLESSKVTISVEPTAQVDTVNLRVTSSSMIDEPVVTVYVRAGCSQKTTRRYVLLADYPTDTAPVTVDAAPVKLASVAPEAPVTKLADTPATPTLVPADKPAPERPRKSSSVKTTQPKSASRPEKTEAPVASASAKPAPAPVTATKANEAPRSRLKLDPLENLAERIKTLEATTSTAPLEEIVKDSQRIQQLQSDVKALLDQAAKNEASLMAMRERMEKAESERVSMGIVWALGALVLLCLAGMATLWSRRKETSNWQHSVRDERSAQPAPHASVHSSYQPASETTPVPVAKVAEHDSTMQMPMLRSDLDIDVNLMDMDTDFTKLMAPAPILHAPTAAVDFQEIRFNDSQFSHQDFNSEAIADVRQQAEFFEKLGKVDQAIDVLEQRIRQNSKDAPLLYLDLLHISNVHNLKTDFRQFRDEFEQLFNVDVSEFALFSDQGRSLESYPSLLQHISKLWPTDSALDVIEACVVRDPMEKNADPFDICAFSDLVLLHGVAYKQLHANEARDIHSKESFEHVDIGM